MIFQRLARTDPERVFMVVRNNEGAAIIKDQTVQWEPASASVDGVRVRDLDTANENLYVGVADAQIADGDYGLVQIYGYRSTSIIFQTNTSIDTGVALTPVAAVDYLSSVASTVALGVHGALLESIASSSVSATVSRKIFIKAM